MWVTGLLGVAILGMWDHNIGSGNPGALEASRKLRKLLANRVAVDPWGFKQPKP